MSPTAGSLFLGLVLCSVGIWAAIPEGVLEKPGTCPPEVVLPECAYSRFAPQCLNDSACDGELKCCHSRCTLRCVQPLKEPEVIHDIEKPGTCPPEVYDPECKFSKFPPQCENDSTCDGELKCCHSRCTLRCVKPLQVKLGSCPPTLAKCKTPLPLPRCKSDSQCPGKKKCCTPFCTQQCTDPIMVILTDVKVRCHCVLQRNLEYVQGHWQNVPSRFPRQCVKMILSVPGKRSAALHSVHRSAQTPLKIFQFESHRIGLA
ncbi:uncharacterized protein LOC142492537 isoform X1 [Ascaphus truei]|uniref:uncharacterized protein LOC142492537 isoform X1 n=1 Tax=Ascaphus truei TaxID=8439 RepID=UPI003F595109